MLGPLGSLNPCQTISLPKPFQEEKNDENNHIIALLYEEEGILAKNARCACGLCACTAQILHTPTPTHTYVHSAFHLIGRDGMVCYVGQRPGNICFGLTDSQAIRLMSHETMLIGPSFIYKNILNKDNMWERGAFLSDIPFRVSSREGLLQAVSWFRRNLPLSSTFTQFFTKQIPLFSVAKLLFNLGSATSYLYSLGMLFKLSVPHLLCLYMESIRMSLS